MSLTRCVPTGWKAGVVEFVEDASTLGEIHTQGGGVTGSFETNILLTWLRKYNQSPLEFETAEHNFTRYAPPVSTFLDISALHTFLLLQVLCWLQCDHLHHGNWRQAQ